MRLSPYYRRTRRTARPGVSPTNLAWLGLGLLALVAVQFFRSGWPFDRSSTQPVPVIDGEDDIDATPRPNPDLAGSYLVVVEESENRSVERLQILNQHDFWFGLEDRGLAGFRVLDPDSPDSKSFVHEAARQSISPPFVMHVANDGKVLGLIEFPDRISAIEAMLK